jgi:predicted transcriptional regulator
VTATATRRIRLTPLQRQTRNALIRFVLANERPPSVRELGEVLGKSATTVVYRLRTLEAVGAIALLPGQRHGIEIVEDVVIEREEDDL